VVLIERGFYSNHGEPLLALHLHVRENQYLPIQVLVDTGFNRSLLVFEDDALEANLPPTRRLAAKAYLANGAECPATSTFGYLQWFGRLEQVEILVVRGLRGQRDRCLVGMELLRGMDILLRDRDFELHATPPEPAGGE